MAIQPPLNIFSLVQSSPVDVIWQQLKHHQVPPLNSQCQTLLFAAVQRQDPSSALQVCKSLVQDHGVDAAHMDRRGQTALHYLAKTGHTDCVDLLLASGAKVDHIDLLMRQTPLFYGARYGTPAMVQSLLSHQADPNRRDVQGKTPMFWVSNPEACKVLVEFGSLCDLGPIGTAPARSSKPTLIDAPRSSKPTLVDAEHVSLKPARSPDLGPIGTAPARSSKPTLIDAPRSSKPTLVDAEPVSLKPARSPDLGPIGTSPARGSKPTLLDGEPVSLKRARSPDLGPSPLRNGYGIDSSLL